MGAYIFISFFVGIFMWGIFSNSIYMYVYDSQFLKSRKHHILRIILEVRYATFVVSLILSHYSVLHSVSIGTHRFSVFWVYVVKLLYLLKLNATKIGATKIVNKCSVYQSNVVNINQLYHILVNINQLGSEYFEVFDIWFLYPMTFFLCIYPSNALFLPLKYQPQHI